MIRFESDYLEGAHPLILEKMLSANPEQTPGYGVDEYCESARKKIRAACALEDNAGVHFLSGGTQANLTACAAFMKPWQGVICAETGHIAVHESGSVEATGHKVLTLAHKNGKITGAQVDAYVTAHYAQDNFEHTVQPGMVYISQPTEYGTLYTKAELKEIYAACRKHGLVLFVDGARLIYALRSSQNDVALSDLARLCDAFYIGGTKAGALLGEAMVITDPALDRDFRYMLKQRGGMLAKGRLLGIQFDVLFTDDLYLEISARANALSDYIRSELTAIGVKFAVPSPTNQLFPILKDEVVRSLSDRYSFSYWESAGEGKSVVRICTSWATARENVENLVKDLKMAIDRA